MDNPTAVRASGSDNRANRSLIAGALIFRWVWLCWMGALAASATTTLELPEVAWASIGAAAVWTAWLTVARRRLTTAALVFDVVLCSWLVIASGIVVAEGGVVSGRPFFATGYPLSAPLLWGATRGLGAGVVVGAILAIAHLLTRPINGVVLGDVKSSSFQNTAGAMLNYLVAGAAVGFVSRLLHRSERALQQATDELVKEREYAARLAERDSIGRAIHDSVLQVLALVHKRGRELASRPSVPSEEVAELSELAGRQEEELRALISRAPGRVTTGLASLRDALETTARDVEGLHVDVSSVGPLELDSHLVGEVTAAVRQALENAAEHSGGQRATVFAEEDDGRLRVSVKDDGMGFHFDEKGLLDSGKLGLVKSVKGRIEELGGTMSIDSAADRGTEIELTVPLNGGEVHDHHQGPRR